MIAFFRPSSPPPLQDSELLFQQEEAYQNIVDWAGSNLDPNSIKAFDNIINSGGVKISPESIENTLSKTLNLNTFFTTSISDSKLGEKLVLISNSKNKISLILEAIKLIKDPILKPKSIYIVNDFEYTDSNKINRKLNKTKALKQKPVYQKQHD